MTKEERAEQKRLRQIEKERSAQEFPGATLNFAPVLDVNWTQIWLESGNASRITLRKNRTSKWHEEDKWRGEDESTTEFISLDLRRDIKGLAALIRALVIRYNAIAKDINSQTTAIPQMEPLALIPPEDPPEVIT